MKLFDDLFKNIPMPMTEEQLQAAIEKRRDELFKDQLERSNAEYKQS